MADFPAQTTQVTGTALTLRAQTAGPDTVPVGSQLIVRNGSAGAVNVTVVTPGNDRYGLARPDIVTAVAAGAVAKFGPFDSDLMDPVTGKVGIIVPTTAGVELWVVGF